MFPEVTEYFSELKKTHDAKHDEWVKKFDAWKAANPKLADELAVSSAFSHTLAEGHQARRRSDVGKLFAVIPEFPADSQNLHPRGRTGPCSSRSPNKTRCS